MKELLLAACFVLILVRVILSRTVLTAFWNREVSLPIGIKRRKRLPPPAAYHTRIGKSIAETRAKGYNTAEESNHEQTD